MTFITHRRGYLLKHTGLFDVSMLFQEVTLDEYLAFQYPPYLMEQFPAQAQVDRDSERREILAASLPDDTYWLWRCIDPSNQVDGAHFERGGLALKRDGKVVYVWRVWEGY